MVLKKNNLVKKRNVVNEIREIDMTLTEYRFFTIYLSRINKDKPEQTRKVRFPLAEFMKIMDLKSYERRYIERSADRLLQKILTLPYETEGVIKFQLFKKCIISRDDNGLYVEIDAHDEALPLMFDFKDKYFQYRVWNIYRLRSLNQFRMYELLAQWRNVGVKEWDVDDLKELLGIKAIEYPEYKTFRRDVLDVCQKALKENTDIRFVYAPCKRGRAGKILRLRFTIMENAEYVDQMTLDMYCDEQGNDIMATTTGGEVDALPGQMSVTDYPEVLPGDASPSSAAPSDATAEPSLKDQAVEVIQFLNQQMGFKESSCFRFVEVNLQPIMHWLGEGFTVEDCKKVIVSKVAEWKDLDKMKGQLNPEVLFGAKFEKYLPLASVTAAANRKAKRKGSFHNFKQNSYDFAALEAELAGK